MDSVIVDSDLNCTSPALVDSAILSELKEDVSYDGIIDNYYAQLNMKGDKPYRQLCPAYPPRRLLSYGTITRPCGKERRGPVAVKMGKHGIIFHYGNTGARKLRGRIRPRQRSSSPADIKGAALKLKLSPLQCLLISFGAMLALFIWLLSQGGEHGHNDRYRIWPITDDDDDDEMTVYDVNEAGVLDN